MALSTQPGLFSGTARADGGADAGLAVSFGKVDITFEFGEAAWSDPKLAQDLDAAA
jgi:hypothetical protein